MLACDDVCKIFNTPSFGFGLDYIIHNMDLYHVISILRVVSYAQSRERGGASDSKNPDPYY